MVDPPYFLSTHLLVNFIEPRLEAKNGIRVCVRFRWMPLDKMGSMGLTFHNSFQHIVCLVFYLHEVPLSGQICHPADDGVHIVLNVREWMSLDRFLVGGLSGGPVFRTFPALPLYTMTLRTVSVSSHRI